MSGLAKFIITELCEVATERHAFFQSCKQTHGLSQYFFIMKNITLQRNMVKLRHGVFPETTLAMFIKSTTELCSFSKEIYDSVIHF